MSEGQSGSIECAYMVAQIATSEIEDNKKSGRVRSGVAGGNVRAESLSGERRGEIARDAARSRWASKTAS